MSGRYSSHWAVHFTLEWGGGSDCIGSLNMEQFRMSEGRLSVRPGAPRRCGSSAASLRATEKGEGAWVETLKSVMRCLTVSIQPSSPPSG